MEEAKKIEVAPSALARTGLAISLTGCVLILLVAGYALLERGSKIEAGPVGLEGNILPPGSVSFVGMLFTGILLLCLFVVGLTLSGVGFFVSMISLSGRDKHTSLLGVLFGVSGPTALLVMYFILTRL